VRTEKEIRKRLKELGRMYFEGTAPTISFSEEAKAMFPPGTNLEPRKPSDEEVAGTLAALAWVLEGKINP